MNNQIVPFTYQGNQIRTAVIDGNPWFVSKDVCSVLELSNSRMVVDRLDDDEKGVSTIDTPGGPQDMSIVNEAGLYSLILTSRKPEAKAFKRWITHEVIPSIRKTGSYSMQLPKTFPEALRLAADLAEQIDRQKPLVAFAETCATSQDSILIRELAKIACKQGVNIGEHRLYRLLRSWKMIFPNSTEPYQEFIDRGYFEVSQIARETSNGTKLFKTTRVTPKGQIYIISRLKKAVA